MDWLVSALGTTGFGSIIGLFGGLITKHLEAKNAAKEMEFKVAMRELDISEGEIERAHELSMADKVVERSQVEGAIKVESLEVGGFIESQKNNRVDGALRWVRPLITGYLLLASTALFAVVWEKTGGLLSISDTELVVMLKMMINAAIFLTVTCVAWWFGSRGGNIGKSK